MSSLFEDQKPQENVTDKKAEAKPADAKTAEAKPGDAKTAAPPTVEELLAKNAKLEAEVKSLKDKNVRLLAEMENVRTIARRDVSNERQYAIRKFGKSLLAVCDNMELALKHVPKEEVTGENANKHFVALYQGLLMTDKELTKALGTEGIVKYGKEGDAFNPNIHEAMFNIPYQEGMAENTIGQVITTGYFYKERVLRPCKAGVIGKKN